MKDKVTCFLPCRAGSQRIKDKNIKPFLTYKHGLIQIKIKQLLAAKAIDEIVVSTNDSHIIDYVESLNETRLFLHRRDDKLASSDTSTDDLISHAHALIPKGHILWTHVTSPFMTAPKYDDIINFYFSRFNDGYDSLMTTTKIYGFLWQNDLPINYKRTIEKWPRTQCIQPVHEVNSCAFLAPSSVYLTLNDRIGLRPYLYWLDKFTGYDIDWPEDFALAECLLEKQIVSV